MATAAPSVLQDFVCSICLEYFKEPHTLLPCNHVYCKACLMQLKSSKIKHCPQCRTSMTGFRADDFIAHKMRTTEVQCRICSRKMQASKVNEHMAQCAVSPEDFEGTNAGNDESANKDSLFQCPFCRKDEIKTFDLLHHCVQYHKHDKRRVVCPICVSMPWGDPTLESSHLISHLQLRHTYHYEDYAEMWEMDEESALKRALSESLAASTGANVSDSRPGYTQHGATVHSGHRAAPSAKGGPRTVHSGHHAAPSAKGRPQKKESKPEEWTVINEMEARDYDEEEAIFLAVTESLNHSSPCQQPPGSASAPSEISEEFDEDEAIFLAVTESLSDSPCRQTANSASVPPEISEHEAILLAVTESLNQCRQTSSSASAHLEISGDEAIFSAVTESSHINQHQLDRSYGEDGRVPYVEGDSGEMNEEDALAMAIRLSLQSEVSPPSTNDQLQADIINKGIVTSSRDVCVQTDEDHAVDRGVVPESCGDQTDCGGNETIGPGNYINRCVDETEGDGNRLCDEGNDTDGAGNEVHCFVNETDGVANDVGENDRHEVGNEMNRGENETDGAGNVVNENDRDKIANEMNRGGNETDSAGNKINRDGDVVDENDRDKVGNEIDRGGNETDSAGNKINRGGDVVDENYRDKVGNEIDRGGNETDSAGNKINRGGDVVDENDRDKAGNKMNRGGNETDGGGDVVNEIVNEMNRGGNETDGGGVELSCDGDETNAVENYVYGGGNGTNCGMK